MYSMVCICIFLGMCEFLHCTVVSDSLNDCPHAFYLEIKEHLLSERNH